MNTHADKIAHQWVRIEHAMELANGNPALRQTVETLVDSHFALIDEMLVELERRRMTGPGKIWTV